MLIIDKRLLFASAIGLLGAIGVLQADVSTGKAPITVNLGDTNNLNANVSYLVFDESSLGTPIIYAWHYNGLTNPNSRTRWSGSDLMNAVAADSAPTPWALSYTTGEYGFITSVTIGSKTSIVIDPYGSPLWTYWIKGGDLDAYNYDTYENFTISPLDWVVAPSASDSRWLAPGSYDGWTISPFVYTGTTKDIINFTDNNGSNQAIAMGIYSGGAPLSGVSAIPEPSTLSLLALSVASLFIFLRWKSVKQR